MLKLLTTTEAAGIFRMSRPEFIKRHVETKETENRIPFVREGDRILFCQEDIQKWIMANKRIYIGD